MNIVTLPLKNNERNDEMFFTIYSGFRFLFELLCITIAGYWGFNNRRLKNLRFLAGVLAPAIIIVIWSLWGAPASPNRLHGYAKIVLELGIYFFSAILLSHTKFNKFTLGFIIIGIANACINHFFE